VVISIGTLYTVEIADVNIRGILGAFPAGMALFGFFLASLFGAIVSWPVLTGIGLIFPRTMQNAQILIL